MIDQLAALGTIDDELAKLVARNARSRLGALAPLPEAAHGGRRARRLTVGAVAIAAAVAILLAVNTGGSSDADAAVLHRALLAVTAPAHTVEHIRVRSVQGSHVLTTESWQSVDDPGSTRYRQTSSDCGSWVTDISGTREGQQWFDPDHDRVLTVPSNPAAQPAAWPPAGPRTEFDPTVPFAKALRDGDAHVVGELTLGGIAVTEIAWPESPTGDPDSRNNLFVATATGVPVAIQWGGGKLDATGGVVADVRFEAYEFLPDGGASARALSAAVSHPTATVQSVATMREFDSELQVAQRTHCTSVG
jgi:hypothetical protein